ncbi:MAG: hypothetical protein ACR2PX_09890 [Endozoicomonas sp.]|uniref:hypothetical protein n=1 Tax=Endozoicomonas sp. TaxID=1892382 RepID=UPI003D9B66D2
MAESLFAQLKKIGIDEELAHQVSASLDPDYNASKKDVLIMQEAIMQVQLKSESSYNTLRAEISDARSEVTDVRSEVADVRNDVAGVRSEVGAMHRQYWITFGGLITTILSVFGINWYFH